MQLNSDIELKHPLWEKAEVVLLNKTNNKDDIGFFKRLIDIFIVACAIGIREDKTITKIDDPLENHKTIGRNTYSSLINTDLKNLLDHMLQNALICSDTIDFDLDERLRLAFDPDYTNGKISAASFLVGFANYGIVQIFEHVKSTSSLLVIDELHEYFNSLTESSYDEILNNLTLEDLIKYN